MLPAELSVMIDDTICSLAKDDITDTVSCSIPSPHATYLELAHKSDSLNLQQIRCFPPDTVLPGDRLVRVSDKCRRVLEVLILFYQPST